MATPPPGIVMTFFCKQHSAEAYIHNLSPCQTRHIGKKNRETMTFNLLSTTIGKAFACIVMLLMLLISETTAQHTSLNNMALPHSEDKYNFSNNTLLQNEEAFKATFVSLADELKRLSPTDAAALSRKIANNVSAIDNPNDRDKAYQLLVSMAQEILADTLSEKHNALINNIFTKTLNLTFYADMARRNENTYLEKNLKKNMPGTTAADFTFIERNGKRHTLHKEKAAFTVILFYDPDCHVCHDMARQLANQKIFTENTDIKVITIYTDNDTENWRNHASDFPKTWIDACSPNGEMAEKQIFYLPIIPSLYLLDAKKHVLLRDVSVETLFKVVEEIVSGKSK